ncbi:zeta toxin family protein [Streptomyces chrestomyceticus]|uniref:zeta toxin family protein n=1 Tax=Streptomyces chrestomyceticus TaxID=68185 RepID=UPI0035A95D10
MGRGRPSAPPGCSASPEACDPQGSHAGLRRSPCGVVPGTPSRRSWLPTPLSADDRRAGVAVRPDTRRRQEEAETYVRRHRLAPVMETALADAAAFRAAATTCCASGHRSVVAVPAGPEAARQLSVLEGTWARPKPPAGPLCCRPHSRSQTRARPATAARCAAWP